jgi:hypothetical protein
MRSQDTIISSLEERICKQKVSRRIPRVNIYFSCCIVFLFIYLFISLFAYFFTYSFQDLKLCEVPNFDFNVAPLPHFSALIPSTEASVSSERVPGTLPKIPKFLAEYNNI